MVINKYQISSSKIIIEIKKKNFFEYYCKILQKLELPFLKRTWNKDNIE